jgi:thiamine biosynthesis lipoprotein ApbE
VNPISRRDCFKAGAAGLCTAVISPAAETRTLLPDVGLHSFHHDHIIGTSLDLWVAAPDEQTAETAETAALMEIERLRRVLSVYDPESEVSHLNRTRGPAGVSPDLAAVLRGYDRWRRETLGAFHGQLGELTRLWKRGEAEGELPAAVELERIVQRLAVPGWHLDPVSESVQLTTEQPLELNALGKAYILECAVRAIRTAVPAVTGLLLNVGGDVVAWGGPPGRTGWAVGIQDPFQHFDNAPPLAGLSITDQAVASSGGYQRYYTIGGRRYSHVLDPRTGHAAAGVAGATVVAGDAVTANAVATTLCVLPPDDGLRLVARVPGAECLIVASDGTQYRSPGLRPLTVERVGEVRAQEKKDPKPGDAWPEGFQVTVGVELPKIDAKRYRRPYVAVWVEDGKGKAVRTLGVWGNAPKYLKDLNDWWKIGKDDQDLVKAVARATRGPGKYDLVWDGKDDKGGALPQGTYTVRVEVHREFGEHLRQSGKIECRDKAVTLKLDKNAETAETVVEFKKAEKK